MLKDHQKFLLNYRWLLSVDANKSFRTNGSEPNIRSTKHKFLQKHEPGLFAELKGVDHI